MPNEKISEFSPNGPLTGNEIVPLVQGGANVKATLDTIAEFINESGFDPNNIQTFLRFVGNHWIGKSGTADSNNAIFFYDAGSLIVLTPSTGVISSVQLSPSKVQLLAQNGLDVNTIEVTPEGTFLGKVARYQTLPEITEDGDLVHKKWVEDAIAAGLGANYADFSWKQPVHVATTAPLPAYTVSFDKITLTASANGSFPGTIDGQGPIGVDTIILVKDETAKQNNGIYIIDDAGSSSTPWVLNRRGDLNTGARAAGAIVYVLTGTANGGKLFKQITTSVTIGTTWLDWQEVGGDFEVVDNLSTTDASKALSANQGKVLNDLVTSKISGLPPTYNQAVLFWKNGLEQDYTNFFYDDVEKILVIRGALPRLRIMNINGSYMTIDRVATSNKLSIKNQVVKAGGIGKCVNLVGGTKRVTFSGSGLVSANMTISLWFKTNYSAGPQTFFEIGNPNGASNNTFLVVGLNGSSGVVMNTCDTCGSPTASGNYADGVWHNLIITRTSGSGYSMYVDNVFKVSFGNNNLTAKASGSEYLGWSTGFQGGGYTGQMYIDQFAVWNVVLNSTERTALYNAGAGTASVPQSSALVRKYEFEEGTGTTALDSSPSGLNGTLVNAATYDNNGLVPAAGSAQEATLIESTDGLTNSENGVVKFGDYNGKTTLQGNQVNVFINNLYPAWFDLQGRMILDAENDGNSVATAKVNIGRPLSTMSQLKLQPNLLPTSAINVGDVNHVLSQRTWYKRKGSTNANSLWLTDCDTHFVAGLKSVTSALTATSILGTPGTSQTLTYPADFFVVGKVAVIEVEGLCFFNNGDTFKFDFTLGSTTVATTGNFVNPTDMAISRFRLRVKIYCTSVGTSGAFYALGELCYNDSSTTEKVISMSQLGSVAINTTIAQAMDVKVTWSANGTNSINTYVATGMILN